MESSLNLANRLRKQLPRELYEFLQLAGRIAGGLNIELYLVGGVVRDLLLGRPNLDIDLVAEGDATHLAREIARQLKGEAVYHPRFKTATVRWDRWSADLATARTETYSKPGALPTISPSTIEMDLIRRDFAVNAMAIILAPLRYGNLLDLFNGQSDLESRLIRILHDNSFEDDSTRIWRAVRYEQRLGFEIEQHTLNLLKRDLPYLNTISGDRLRHELELVLKEEKPEKALVRADSLGILRALHPSLKADARLARHFARLRSHLQPYSVSEEVYLALFIYNLSPLDLEVLQANLKFSKEVGSILKDALKLKTLLPELAKGEISNSRIYNLLHPFSPTAIMVTLTCTRLIKARQRIELYLGQLRQFETFLNGEDLIRMGMKAGPHIHQTLGLLLDAALDGQTASRQDELALLKKIGGPKT
jgi:tRNA nucleotidyltransferase (CCA-adding enzyme)